MNVGSVKDVRKGPVYDLLDSVLRESMTLRGHRAGVTAPTTSTTTTIRQALGSPPVAEGSCPGAPGEMAVALAYYLAFIVTFKPSRCSTTNACFNTVQVGKFEQAISPPCRKFRNQKSMKNVLLCANRWASISKFSI